jgi:RimJ/RimL family protein N-acetyltransferase
MHKGTIFSINNYQLQPLTVDLQEKMEMIFDGLQRIFSNEHVIKFNRNRHLPKKADVSRYFLSTVAGYQNETHFDYFLIDRVNDRLAGTMHLISPKLIKQSYPLLNYFIDNNRNNSSTWVIEFYLDPLYWNKGIMSYFLGKMIEELFIQKVTNICAFTNSANLPSISLLKKFSFKLIDNYKDTSGQILWNLKH